MNKFSFLMIGLATISSAQESKDTIAIQEISILNNRLNTPVSKENRNVYVLGKQEIKNLPVKTLQEVLQYANGIDLRQRGPFGSQADVSMDGGSFEQTLVLLNGVKIMDHQTAHNALNLPLPLEAIDRVEIVRGPAARIFGNNSLTGVINIITREAVKSGYYGHSYFGSNFKKDDTDKLFTNRGIQIGGNLVEENHQHQLHLSHETGNGYRYNTAFENNKLYYEGNFKLNNSNSIKASYGYVKNSFGANGFYASPGDKDSQEIVETTLASIQSNHQISQKWDLKSTISYRYNFDDYRYFKYDLNRARSKHYSNSISGEINSTYKFSRSILGIGVEVRNEQINSTNINKHERNNVGIYAEYKGDITPKLNANIGTYINYNSQNGWKIFPGIDASYAINSNLKIVGNVGTSQRIPSFTDLYLDQRPGNIGNPNVKAETSLQSEIGFRWKKKNWTANAYYFNRKIQDFIDWVRISNDEPWQANNFGDMSTNGLNIKGTYLYNFNENNQLKFDLGYSYLDPKFKNVDETFNSKYKIESLKHQLIGTINYQLHKTSVMIANRYNTRQSYKSYWITDLRISQTIKDNFSVYLDAQNLLNTSYNEIGAIPLPSRWVSVGIKFIGI